eukprot:gene7189-10355_t
MYRAEAADIGAPLVLTLHGWGGGHDSGNWTCLAAVAVADELGLV